MWSGITQVRKYFEAKDNSELQELRRDEVAELDSTKTGARLSTQIVRK